ncbi:uncharacterized protein LOC101848563 isoform X2 [Aplysia californica]|uniref:Uncharacterized protein LOC101848563 isoform X2 n=1 Tax=Aplysia californica TaxID=6500 RepID=A0ABM0KAE0_APLCA|nr:uncharacterized protein LOC101848563 isoform X2 [Aplysia californica]
MIIAGTDWSHSKNGQRPLPHTPLPHTPLDCDSGYEEIDENAVSAISGASQNEAGPSPYIDVINDGYEVPVSPRSLSVGTLPAHAHTHSRQNESQMNRRATEGGRYRSAPNVEFLPKDSETLYANRRSRQLYSNDVGVDTQM